MQQLSLTVKCVTRIGRSSAGRPRHKWIERFQVPAGGRSGGIPLWPRSILNASLWGGWRTDAGDGESPRYVIMLAECGGPCGPAGGTDHLVLSLCVSMSVMERQKRKRARACCCSPSKPLRTFTGSGIHNSDAKMSSYRRFIYNLMIWKWRTGSLIRADSLRFLPKQLQFIIITTKRLLIRIKRHKKKKNLNWTHHKGKFVLFLSRPVQ